MSVNESMSLWGRMVGVLVALLLGACGADIPVTAADAGVDSGIAPPAPPVLTPCPMGWREVTDAHGLVTCDPWPESGYRTDCAFDEGHFAGTPGCARIGTECAADGWPSDLPTDRVIVYVDDGAAPGGDGASRGTAFQRIREAVSASPDGAVIAVATGLYDENVILPTGVTLWGACVSGTRLMNSAPSEMEAGLTLHGARSGARNLGVDGSERMGVLALGASPVSLDRVVIEGCTAVGLVVFGSSMTATDIVVRGTRPRPSDGTLGNGVVVEAGGRLVLSRALVEHNRDTGMMASGVGASVEASDVVVRGTRERASDQTFGGGVDVELGARLVLSRAFIDDNRVGGINVRDAESHLEASDVVVRGTREQVSDGTLGIGVMMLPGAQAVLSRALVEDNREVGILASGIGANLEAHDVVVRSTRGRASTGIMGQGIDAQLGAHVALSRVIADDNRYFGIILYDADTSVAVSDVLVRGTRERASDGTGGGGIGVAEGAHLVLSRALVEDSRANGIIVSDLGSTLEATQLIVRDTLPQSADGTLGVGLAAQDGARAVVTGARVERSHFLGMGSLAGASVVLRDVVVSAVGPSACPAHACAGETGGFGLVAIFGGTLDAAQFVVEGATLCGVMVGRSNPAMPPPTALDLESGVIDRSMIGACVQVDGYDTTRLQHGVEYRDVGVPLRATSYEIPSDLPTGATP